MRPLFFAFTFVALGFGQVGFGRRRRSHRKVDCDVMGLRVKELPENCRKQALVTMAPFALSPISQRPAAVARFT
jgi:hypothetical protein